MEKYNKTVLSLAGKIIDGLLVMRKIEVSLIRIPLRMPCQVIASEGFTSPPTTCVWKWLAVVTGNSLQFCLGLIHLAELLPKRTWFYAGGEHVLMDLLQCLEFFLEA